MKTRLAVIISAIVLAGYIFAGEHSDEAGELDMPTGRETNAHVIFRLVKSMPHFFSVRRAARRCEKNLPEVKILPTLPGSEEIYQYVRDVCATPHRRPGTPEGHRAEDYIAAKFREFGLSQVTREPINITVWNARNWKLKIEQAGKIIDFPCFYVVNTGFTGPRGVSGEMVYAGMGRPKDFDKVDVKGKIVVAECTFPDFPVGRIKTIFNGGYYTSDPGNTLNRKTSQVLTFVRRNFPPQYIGQDPWEGSVYWQAYHRGALGLVLILNNHPGDTNSHYGPYDGVMKPLPALYVSSYAGERLRTLVANRAKATIVIEGAKKPGATHNVWGILPGLSEETIMVTTHHDSPFKGATEDGTGVAMVLAQAKAWSQAPLEKRKRTILFVCAAGHFYAGIGSEHFARKHKNDLMKNAIIDINLEHLAAKEVEDINGKFVPNGRLATTVIFVTENPVAIATAGRMCRRHQPPRTLVVPSTLLGPVPPGEGGHYHSIAGVDIIHWIGCPYYLLTAEDTLDKVDKNMLGPLAKAVTELVGTYMAMP